MNYLWEVALKADSIKVPREEVRYKPALSCSPYIEAAFENLNEEKPGNSIVEANPLFRFTSIFARMLDINVTHYQQMRELFFDVVMQYMIQIDLREGLSKGEYYLRFFIKDLLTNTYGRDCADALLNFTHIELRKLLVCMRILFCNGSSVALFRRSMRAVYPSSLVYSNNEVYRELLIYIGKQETAQEQKKIRFLLNVFLPINYRTHLFWEHHFGIIDVDVTMELDEMVLF